MLLKQKLIYKSWLIKQLDIIEDIVGLIKRVLYEVSIIIKFLPPTPMEVINARYIKKYIEYDNSYYNGYHRWSSLYELNNGIVFFHNHYDLKRFRNVKVIYVYESSKSNTKCLRISYNKGWRVYLDGRQYDDYYFQTGIFTHRSYGYPYSNTYIVLKLNINYDPYAHINL